MDKYPVERDHGDTVYLEEEPLMTTTQFEILSYPGQDPASGDESGTF